MLFGIYTAAHGTTCQSRPGSYLYERIDSRSYCEFGIDYLKIDQCGGDSYEHHGEDKNMSWLAFQRGFKECLQSTGRAIVQSVESCGTVSGCGEWIANCANLWRTGSDLEATWGSVMKNLDQTAPLFSLAGVRDTGMGVAEHWNDPDMLQVWPATLPRRLRLSPSVCAPSLCLTLSHSLCAPGRKRGTDSDREPLALRPLVLPSSSLTDRH